MIKRLDKYLETMNYRKINFTLVLIIFLLFEYSYYVFVSKVYHIFFFNFDITKYSIAKLMFLAAYFLIGTIKTQFLYLSAMAFLVVMYIPNLILYQFMPFNFSILIHLSFFLILLVVAGQKKVKINQQLKSPHNSHPHLLLLLTVLMMIPFFATYKLNVNFSVFSLDEELYRQRLGARLAAGSYISYTMSWLAKIILPILLLIALYYRKKLIAAVTLLLMLYMFVTLSHKVFLFAPIVAVGFYYIRKTNAQVLFILLGIIAVAIISRIATERYDYLDFEATFVRRVFFIPAILNDSYFHFFENDPQYFSNSFLASFRDYAYALQPPNLIARTYWGKHFVSANNGFISDGFMHMGHIGVVLFSIIVAAIFKFIDALKVHARYNGVFLITFFTFVSSALFTSLLTHGVLLLMLFSYLFLHNTAERHK